ncbi:PE domain-containing protein [Pseudonocardia autotrophica]|nr:PE domain-containing protein [Pseudonocardia autotrophica]
MDIDARLPRGTASDSLMTQIDIGNVLQVRDALAEQSRSIQQALRAAYGLSNIGRCGDDPVSRDAQKMFQREIEEIFAAQRAHIAELDEACDRLGEAARQYGLVEDEAADSFRSTGAPQGEHTGVGLERS